MFIYFTIYFVAAYAAINNASKVARSSKIVWIIVALVLTVIIGLRHHVGGDWNNYYKRFYQLGYMTYEEAIGIKDVGYQTIAYMVHDLGWGEMYLVNFICAIFFVTGLIVFLRRQPNAWLGLTVAIPYLIIVVSMGYTRQAIAIGFVMWGLAALDRGKFKSFLFFVFLAVLFHKSAILMMAFGIFQQGKGKLIKVASIGLAGAGIWFSFVDQGADVLIKNYLVDNTEYESQGAMVRVLLNLLPAILLLVYRKEWKRSFNDFGLWFMVALASIASVGLVSFASTAVDRMALYFIPIQLVVFARLPYLARKKVSPKTTTVLIVLLYALVMYVWLFHAANSRYWVPYQNIIFYDLL